MEEFCFQLPKIELHAHWSGSIPDHILMNKLQELFHDSNSTNSAQKIFNSCKIGTPEFNSLKSTIKSIGDITEGILDDYYKENVCLVELRTTPKKLDDGSNEKEHIIKILNIMKDYVLLKKGRFFTGLILSINRAESVEKAKNTVKLYQEIKNDEKFNEIKKFLLGIDFSGSYYSKKFSDFDDVFKEIKILGIPTTIHLAEIPDNEESKKIIDYKPNRVGHALFLDDLLLTQLISSEIPVELCISSNVLSKRVRTVKEHIFDFYYKNKHPISINTDDRTVFSTSVSKECYQVCKNFDYIGKNEMFLIQKKSIEHSFMNEEIKKKVLGIFDEFNKQISEKKEVKEEEKVKDQIKEVKKIEENEI